MFCALLTSRYQVSIYRTNGPLIYVFFCFVVVICGLVHDVDTVFLLP